MNPLAKKLNELTQDQLAGIYKAVFSSVDSQLVLEDLKQRCYVYAPLPMSELGQRAEGMREMMIHIQTMLEYEPSVKPEVE